MNTAVSRDTLISRVSDIVASQMDDEYLIMSIEMGSYIALRDVSARIWELVDPPVTLASLLESLLAEYTVAPDTCEQEVSGFLKQMAENRLITLEQAS